MKVTDSLNIKLGEKRIHSEVITLSSNEEEIKKNQNFSRKRKK